MKQINIMKPMKFFLLLGFQFVFLTQLSAQVTINEDFETWSPAQTSTSCSGDLGAEGGGWLQDPTDGGDWRLDAGGTTSSSTGPSADYNPGTSTGYYLYTESGSPCYGTVCNLESPYIDLNTYNYQLDFAYHMYGAAMGSLSIDVWQDTVWVLDVWTMAGTQGNQWNTASVNLSTFTGDSTKVRFRGVTGTSYTSDMAIDDISLFPLVNDDMAVIGISPSSICSGTTDLFAIVENTGGNAVTSFLLDWSFGGTAQSQVSYSDSIYPGEIDTILLGNVNFVNSTYDIEITVSMPNGVIDSNPTNSTYSLLPFYTSLNGTYTIGATGDFADFATAISTMQSAGVCGPIVFEVEAGTYTEQITLNEIPGVDASNTVTFKSASGVNTDVVVEFAATGSSDNWVVFLDGADYYTFQDMTLKSAANGSYTRVVRIDNGAHHNSFIGNVLQGKPASGTSYNMAVVMNESGGGDSSLVIMNNKILNGSYGVYMNGTSGAYEHNNKISGNEIEGFYYYGIYLYYQNGVEVEYNTINGGTYSTAYGIYTYYVYGPSLINGNQIHTEGTSTNYGMRLYYFKGDGATALVSNNAISQAVGTGTTYGFYVYYTSDANIYNNSVNITTGSSSGTACYVYQSTSGGYGNIRMANNSFVNTGGGYAMHIHDNAMNPGMVAYHDYNNYFATGSTIIKFGLWDVNTLTDLNQIEPHSIMVDPGYINTNDLHSYSPLLADAGKALSSVDLDIDMEPRDPVNPNIGADEYTLYNNDAGLTAFGGIDAICPGTIAVYADVNNFGVVELTQLTINWTINGVTQTPINLTDTIPVGGATNILLGNYTFLSGTAYDVEAWTSMPNGVADPSTSNDSISVLGIQTAAGGTFTVGTGGDFATISDAQNFITNFGVCGPVVFNILPGTYNEQVSLIEVTGVDSINTVTWQSSTGDASDVTIQYGASGTGDNWVWAFNGADYNTVQNITIKSNTTGTYGRVVIFQNSSNYNTVDGNIIESVTGSSSNAACIRSYSDSKDEYNTISNNQLLNGYYGIYFYASSSNMETGNQFINNQVEDFYYYGIYNYYQYDNTVSGNYVHQSQSGSSTGYNIYLRYCDGPFNVESNTVYDDAGSSSFYGLYIYYCDADAAAPALVANNMVSNNGNTGTSYGIYAYYSNHINIYHNSVMINTGGTTYGAYLYGSSSSGVYDFKNNNIVNMEGDRALYGTSSVLPNLTSSNNNLYTTGTSLCYFSSSYATIADWQTQYPGDVLNTDGGYLAADNLHSNSLALDGGAMPIAGITTDIDGELRDATNPDVGADEYTLANDDAALTALPGITAVCPGINDVVATISNYGLVDMNNVVVNWSVNGVTQPAFSNTTTIPVGGSLDVVIGTYDMLANTTYDFTAWTTLPNGNVDPNTGNDSITVAGVTTSISGNFTIGATGDFATFGEAVNYIDSLGICGPVVFDVESGTYTEQVTIPEINGASASNTITFQSATGNNTDVTVQFAATSSSSNWVWAFNGADYVTVKNMTIKSNASSYARVVIFQGSSNYNTVENNILESIVSTSSNATVIRSYTDSKDEHNTIIGNEILNGYYGIYFYGSSSLNEEGNQFIDNNITNYGYYGLYAYYQYGTVIDGNYLYQNPTGSSTNYSLYVRYCDGPVQVLNNKVHDDAGSTLYGIYIYYCDADATTPTLVANNMVTSDGNTGSVYALRVYYSTYTNIYNNSVYIQGGSSTYGAYLYGSSSSGPYDFKNNSIVNLDDGYALYGTSSVLGYLTSSNNNLYSNGTLLCDFTTDFPTLVDWQANYPGDVVSTMGDYLSTSDLHTFSIFLNGAGAPLAEVTTDIDGDPRDVSNPDIGADEFDLQVPANNLAVDIVYTLGQQPLGAGDNHVVEAIITNLGADAQINVPVTLTIAGVNNITDTYTIPSISSGQIMTIEFDPYTSTMVGPQTVTVSVPADMDNSNNSANYGQIVTPSNLSYSDTSAIVDRVGHGSGTGTILAKYFLNGVQTIAEVGAFITDTNSVGANLKGIVLDSLGNVLSQSDNVTIGTVDSIYNFPLLDPLATTTANGEVYIGIVQNWGSAGYYPVGVQSEDPVHANTYFLGDMNGANLVADNMTGRYAIGAVIGTPAAYDAACLEILEPIGGCGLTANENVTIKIQNLGANNITSGLTASFQVNTGTVVTETIPTGILSGDILTYTFTGGANLLTTADSTFVVNAWVDLTNDNNQNNDSTTLDVQSLYQPDAPIAINTTVLYGSMATLAVNSPDSIQWYEDPTSTSPIGSGTSLTVGPLFDTVTYYAQAGGSASPIAITEVGLGGTDYIELQNMSSSTFDATGWYVVLSDNYSTLNSANSNVWQLGQFLGDEIQTASDASGGTNYWGSNIMWNANSNGWAAIIDDNNEVADFIVFGWSAAELLTWAPVVNGITLILDDEWIGDGIQSFSSDYIARNNFDSNEATDWINSSINNIGTANANMTFSSSTGSCNSVMVPVTAFVANIPAYDVAVVDASSPVSAIDLTANEIITVEIQNWGTMPANGFQVTYDINGNIQQTEVMTTPIAAGTSESFSFATSVDLSMYGTYTITVYTQLMNDGYPTNDTMVFEVINIPPPYCQSNATSTNDQEITEVVLSTLSNYSLPTGAQYTDYSSSVAPALLSLGATYPISITSDYAPGWSTSYNCWVEVYIDWNHDGVYSDPSEVVFSSSTVSSNTVTGVITVPATATPGNHGMRIVLEETSSANNVNPCGTYTWGETEDYRVVVQEQIPYDAGVIEILSPSGNLLQNTSEPVQVVVFNFGTQTITNMDVVSTIDGLNPQVINYTGSLAPLTADTIWMNNIVIPLDTFELCAHTILTDDINTFNDEVCATLEGMPQFDLVMVSIDAPADGCDLGMENVTVSFTNVADTITGTVPVSFLASTMTTALTENYTGTILPGDTVSFTFSAQANLAVSTQTNIDLSSWISYTNDGVSSNDTVLSSVLSSVAPDMATVNDTTIAPGTFATLSVINPDTNLNYFWYDTLGNDMIYVGADFTTPVLYDTTSYYVVASEAMFGDVQLGTGTSVSGTSGYPNPYQTYYWGNREQLLILADELLAFGFTEGYINSLAFNVITPAPISMANFTMKIGATTATSMSSWQTGLTEVYFNPSESNVAGWNTHEFSTPFWWDGVSNVVIETCFNNPGYQSGGQIEYTSTSFTSCKVYRADATGVCSNTGSSLTSSNRPNMILNMLDPGCAAAPVQANAFVEYADYDGAVVDIVSPVSASNMNNAAVTIEIYNNGTLDLQNFNVQYVINGGTPVVQMVNHTIAPGTSYTFTFTDSANVSVFGAYDICASTMVSNDGFAGNDQICSTFNNWEGNGETCATAFPYLMLNDPAVFQTTMHPYDRHWWRFELPVDANNVHVSLCGSSFDTKLEVHDACPQTGYTTSAYLGYNDDGSCGNASEIVFTNMSAGTYWARVYGSGADFGDYILEITGELDDIATVTMNATDIDCNGAANGTIDATVVPIVPGATLPVTYLWSNNETSLNLTGLAPGTYTLTITDDAGITQEESVTITEPTALSLSLSATDATTFGGNNGAIDATISGGTTPYAFLWSNGEATEDLATAYAGVYTLTVADANGCEIEETVTVNSPVPAGWSSTPTANSHSIVVDELSSITLDGIDAAYGSLIGVFYNQNGTMVCGGWAYWSGMTTTIIAYGATIGQDNGFEAGENFSWRLYEAALNVEYGGSACYIQSYPNEGTFVNGGFSGINCLDAQSIILQPIDLPSGWSIWSTYIDPVDPNMAAILDSITAPAFNPGPVEIVKSGTGLIYWPFYSLNTIGNIIMGQGYQIKMNSAETFHVQGMLIDPVLNPITLPSGWSIMGYLRTSPMNIATMMTPITAPAFNQGPVEIVKSGTGLIYWPFYALNTIGNMMPGQGYQIKMNSTETFYFPANTTAPSKSATVLKQPVEFTGAQNTGHNMSLGILETAWTTAPQVGDEIGVFNSNGELIGSTVFENGFNAITVWGDDSQTKEAIEGIANGDVFTLQLWNNTQNKKQEIVVESWFQGNDQYATDAIAVIEKLAFIDGENQAYKLFQNYPNPFNNATEISFYLPETTDVELVVYNSLGEVIEVMVSKQYEAGKHIVSFETNILPSGTYFYKLISEQFTDTKAMNIQ